MNAQSYKKSELTFPVWLRIKLPTTEAALIDGQPAVLLMELYPEQYAAYTAYVQDLELRRRQQQRRTAIARQLALYEGEASEAKKPFGAAFGIKSKSELELGGILHGKIEQHVFSISS